MGTDLNFMYGLVWGAPVVNFLVSFGGTLQNQPAQKMSVLFSNLVFLGMFSPQNKRILLEDRFGFP